MVAAVAVVLVLVVGVVLAFQRSLVFVPDRSAPPPVSDVLPGAREVRLSTADGLTLAAWWLPAPAACTTTVLVTPGNGGNRAARVPLAAALGEAGFGVLLLEYRGYGGNPGSPSEVGLVRDARAARAYLVDAGVPATTLVYLGESLGAAVAAALAAEHPPAALVLRSPFTTLADAAQAATHLPVAPLLHDRFDVVAAVRQTSVPVAVVLGDVDATVPPRQSRAVADAAREADRDVVEVVVPRADHNDPALASGPALVEAVRDVARAGGAAPC
ncbi:alpha/beta hydrolase [Cellulomonas terrae]|uniref:Alpha/beta hydrolase n=1 Tax=Cellulomonas terrae TaxID=311234 RepID=A0A511JH54_9CELL|nr:alpha/beta hydrolase [Cellulomonas terrae]